MNCISNFCRIILLLIIAGAATSLKVQTSVCFSGKWEPDKAHSKLTQLDVSYDGTVVLEVTQTDTTDTYKTNGKDEVIWYDKGAEKKSAQWSKDKSKLIITNQNIQTMKGIQQEFLTIDT